MFEETLDVWLRGNQIPCFSNFGIVWSSAEGFTPFFIVCIGMGLWYSGDDFAFAFTPDLRLWLFYSTFHPFNFHLYLLNAAFVWVDKPLSLFFSFIKKSKSLCINLMILVDFKYIIETLKLRYKSLFLFVYFITIIHAKFVDFSYDVWKEKNKEMSWFLLDLMEVYLRQYIRNLVKLWQ